MGMSASQGRMLSLTARLSDLEYSAQSISNSKIRLATQSEEVAKDYADALDKKKLMVATGYNSNTGATTYSQATVAMLTNYDGSSIQAQRILKNSNGEVMVSNTVGTAYQTAGDDNLTGFLAAVPMNDKNDDSEIAYYTKLYNEIQTCGGQTFKDEQINNSAWLYDQLQNGNLYLEKWNAQGGEDGNGSFDDLSWSSGDPTLEEQTDNADMSKAEAKYNYEMAAINSKDKRYDLDLKNIDTEHGAIQSEIDSVKKVIDKNIERSFKIFS